MEDNSLPILVNMKISGNATNAQINWKKSTLTDEEPYNNFNPSHRISGKKRLSKQNSNSPRSIMFGSMGKTPDKDIQYEKASLNDTDEKPVLNQETWSEVSEKKDLLTLTIKTEFKEENNDLLSAGLSREEVNYE